MANFAFIKAASSSQLARLDTQGQFQFRINWKVKLGIPFIASFQAWDRVVLSLILAYDLFTEKKLITVMLNASVYKKP